MGSTTQQPTMRFQLSFLTILATVALVDSVAAICCITAQPGKDPCGNVAYALKIMSEVVTPEACCCSADNSLACRAKCVSHISFILFFVF
jgi:hypothetical protein